MKPHMHPLIGRLLDGELTLADLPAELREEGRQALRWLAVADRTPVTLPPAMEERVMAQVRRHAASRIRHGATWWVPPRGIDIRLRLRFGMVAAVGAAAALALFVVRPYVPNTREVMTGRPTASVRLVVHVPGARRVAVAGTFNHWDPNAALLAPSSNPDYWTISLALPPGVHQYAFLVDGQRWITDPAAPEVDDGFGRQNSVVAVAAREGGSQAL
jgi:Glycogen recognition site of AMP-activated protein kinase